MLRTVLLHALYEQIFASHHLQLVEEVEGSRTENLKLIWWGYQRQHEQLQSNHSLLLPELKATTLDLKLLATGLGKTSSRASKNSSQFHGTPMVN